MSFPPARNPAEAKQRKAEWQAWVKRNDALIAASGIPAETVMDKGHWESFLEWGDLYPVDFHHFHLPLGQKIALLRLISTRPKDLSSPIAGYLIEVILDALEPRI